MANPTDLVDRFDGKGNVKWATTGQWKIIDGQFHQTQIGGGRTIKSADGFKWNADLKDVHHAITGSTEWEDYVLFANMQNFLVEGEDTFERRKEERHTSIGFRLNEDATSGYLLSFGHAEGGHFRLTLYSLKDGVKTFVRKGTGAGAPNWLRNDQVKVQVIGKTLTVQVNGWGLFWAVDLKGEGVPKGTFHAKGRVGLFTNGCKAAFDNFRVLHPRPGADRAVLMGNSGFQPMGHRIMSEHFEIANICPVNSDGYFNANTKGYSGSMLKHEKLRSRLERILRRGDKNIMGMLVDADTKRSPESSYAHWLKCALDHGNPIETFWVGTAWPGGPERPLKDRLDWYPNYIAIGNRILDSLEREFKDHRHPKTGKPIEFKLVPYGLGSLKVEQEWENNNGKPNDRIGYIDDDPNSKDDTYDIKHLQWTEKHPRDEQYRNSIFSDHVHGGMMSITVNSYIWLRYGFDVSIRDLFNYDYGHPFKTDLAKWSIEATSSFKPRTRQGLR